MVNRQNLGHRATPHGSASNMSTTGRRYWLKMLNAVGVKSFRAKSAFGLPYICYVGDLAGELPFYNRRHSAAEIELMAAWCRELDSPVIFDVGANNGFVATQVAQMLHAVKPTICAFEPVPSTFKQLDHSVRKLGLEQVVIPLCCAVSDAIDVVGVYYDPCQSLFAQVRDDAE